MEEKKITVVDPVPQEPQNISFLFHLITITITCAIAYTLINITVEQPTPVEKLVLINSLTPDFLHKTHMVPVAVRAGLSIFKYREFDMMSNNFVFEGTIWFEFDPAVIALETISDFEFEKGDIIYKSAPISRLEGDRLKVFYDIIVKFKTELNYKLFPIDDHMVSLVLVNKKVSPQEMIFEIDDQSFIVDQETLSYGWVQASRKAIVGYSKEYLDRLDTTLQIDRPAIQFSILYRRSGAKYALILLMPLMIFIIVMLTAFSYDPQKYFSSIMVANGASLSGLIAFRFVIENMAPKVGYLMISDFFFLVFLALATLLFLISIFSLHIPMRTKKLLILSVHALLILAFVVLVTYDLSFSYHGIELF